MKRSNLKRQSRGAATVEMAICVVILVPAIMYTLFLEDLLYFKLEQYESLSSAAWDYLSLDYNEAKPVPGDDVGGKGSLPSRPNGHFARMTYCDHTSLYNSYDVTFECEDNHHNGTVTTAHQCWIVAGAQQVGCALSKDDYLASGELKGLADWDAQFNRGGVYDCTARLGVMNFFLPNKFFTWSEKRNAAGDKQKNAYFVTKKNRYKSGSDNRQDDDAHGNAARGTGVDAEGSGDIVLAEQKFSVLHDPWATNYPPATDGDNSQGRFHERMEVHYSAYSQQLQTAKAFGQAAVGQQLLGSGALEDGNGDDTDTPTVAWKEEAQRNINAHTASGWEDDRQQNSYQSREPNYFGRERGYW